MLKFIFPSSDFNVFFLCILDHTHFEVGCELSVRNFPRILVKRGILLLSHLEEFLSGADPCRKYWPCAMTAHDVNKKPQALSILFCRRKWQESMFIKKGALLERGLCFQLQSIRGSLSERGDNWEGSLRELLRYVLQGLPTSCLSLEEKHIPFICYFEVTFVYQVSQKSRNV